MTDFERIPIPASRRFVTDFLRIARDRPSIVGLFDADVTEARRLIRDHRDAGGEPLSLTAFIAWTLARTVSMHPRVQAYRHRGGLVVFADVDVTVMVETEEGGLSFPRAHVIRNAGGRSLADVHTEIRDLQSTTRERTARALTWARPFLVLPAAVRHLVYRLYLRNPHRRKRLMGTVAVTAVGMHAEGSFWGIAVPQHTLQLVVGGIGTRPAIVDGALTEREYLSMTLAVDHEVVDGAPAARFADDFKRRLEAADGLADALDEIDGD